MTKRQTTKEAAKPNSETRKSARNGGRRPGYDFLRRWFIHMNNILKAQFPEYFKRVGIEASFSRSSR
tara:strand:+ start:1060 stop:1260 length:201 start_codon:yes stop_codon:yes gene_type:complete